MISKAITKTTKTRIFAVGKQHFQQTSMFSSNDSNNYSTILKKRNHLLTSNKNNHYGMKVIAMTTSYKKYSTTTQELLMKIIPNQVLQELDAEQEELDPKQFNEWTKKQVCFLLCAPEAKGGAGLSHSRVEALFNLDFDGKNLNDIVTLLLEKGRGTAIQTVCSDREFHCIPETTLKMVVRWVEKLISTRLYSLWTIKQVEERLFTPVNKGGAGLSSSTILDEELIARLISDDKEVLDQLTKEDQDLFKAWKRRLLFSIPIESLFYEKRNFKTVEEIDNANDNELIEAVDLSSHSYNNAQHKQWYASYARLILKGELHQFQRPQDKTVYLSEWNKLFQDAYNICRPTINQDKNWYELAIQITPRNTEEVISKLFFEGGNIKLDSMNDVMRVNPFRKDEDGVWKLAKDIIPFIPDLQVPIPDEMKLNELLFTNKFAALIGPGMIGKTGTMVRRLAEYPGIYMNGLTKLEKEQVHGQAIDRSTANLLYLWSATPLENYAFVQQRILTNIISRLVYIRWAIKVWNEKQNKFPFENNLLSFLAFAQHSGNSQAIADIEIQLYEFKKAPTICLVEVVNRLIDEIKTVTDSSTFYFCLDEANILAIRSIILSPNGSKRDLLTLILTMMQQFNVNLMIAGTHFTLEIVDIMLSSTTKGNSMFFLNLVDKDILKKIVEKSCDIPKLLEIMGQKSTWEDFSNEKLSHYLPTRRRVVTTAIELLPSYSYNFEKEFQQAFESYVSVVTENPFLIQIG